MKLILSKQTLYSIAFIFLFTPLFSHKGVIKGTVNDSLSNEIVPGVIIQLQESAQVTSSDVLGNFSFSDVHPGTYTLKMSYPGYRTKYISVKVKELEANLVSVYLAPTAISLAEVEVGSAGIDNAIMNSINKVDIGLRPTRSSQDVLRMIPGLVTAQHAGGGKAEQIFLRGFDIDHGTDIRLSVDGMPVNMVSHAHGQGYADLHFLTPELIEYVDFNKGPYYASQGDLATAGYADFRTKTSLNGSSLKLEAGRFNSYRSVGLFDLSSKKMKAENQNVFIATEYMYTDGYFKSSQNFNRINLTGKYHGLLDNNKILTASFSTFSSGWLASGQIPQRAIDNNTISRFGSIDDKEGGKTDRSNINLSLTSITENGGVFKNQIFFSNYNFELYSNFTFFLEDSINGDQIKQKESRNMYGYNSSFSKRTALAGKKLHSEIGLQFRYDDVDDIELSHTAQRKINITPLALGQINQFNGGLYINENLELTEKLSVNAGARFDQFQFNYVNDLDSLYSQQLVRKSIVSPKLNLFYQVQNNLQLYVKTGTGFHSNDTRAVINDSAKHILPRAKGADLGFFYKPVKRLLINSAVWIMDLEQEFVYVGDAAIVEPSGHTRRYGFDLSARYQVLDWLFFDVDANYTLARSVGNKEGENYIPLAPDFTSIGGVTANFKNGLNMSLRYRHVGDRPANENNTVTALGYSLFDAVINYTTKKYQVGISAENLLNADWNEAQFDTESRLRNESAGVSELHFTPGTPFFVKGSFTLFF